MISLAIVLVVELVVSAGVMVAAVAAVVAVAVVKVAVAKAAVKVDREKGSFKCSREKVQTLKTAVAETTSLLEKIGNRKSYRWASRR